jgi:KipI family sensor histidine kinase inhibitor
VAEVAWAADRCLRVAWGTEASEEAQQRVHAAAAVLRSAGVPGLVDAVPAYATLLVIFALDDLDPARSEALVRRALAAAAAREAAPGRLVTVPVCYGQECAPDLDEVARIHGLERDDVVRLHAGAEYRVGFLGFSPGFPYLAGLPAVLATPRLERPRLRVPAGSVGIAGGQAGIYPQATPGGWRLLGRTPLVLFDPQREPPALLTLGDRVRFAAISHAEFGTQAAGAH